jgi:hypothetical protein
LQTYFCHRRTFALFPQELTVAGMLVNYIAENSTAESRR